MFRKKYVVRILVVGNQMSTRVLYVDSDPARRERTAARIERAGSVRVTACGEAESALDRLAVRPVECVVTAARLPGWTGVELAAAVDRVAPAVPVVVVAPPDGPSGRKLEAAADAFCRRPADTVPVDALCDRIERVTDGALAAEERRSRTGSGASRTTPTDEPRDRTEPTDEPRDRTEPASGSRTAPSDESRTAPADDRRAEPRDRPDTATTRRSVSASSPSDGSAAPTDTAGDDRERPASPNGVSPAGGERATADGAGRGVTPLDGGHVERGDDLRDGGGRLDGPATLAANAPWPVALTRMEDGSPHVRAVNAAFEETFGYDAAELVNEPLDTFVVPDGEEASAAGVNRAADENPPLSVEVARETTEGVRPFQLTVVPTGTPDERWAVYADVSDRVDREHRVRSLHEVALSLLRADDAETIRAETVTAAADLLPADRAVLYVTREGRVEPVAAADDDLPSGPHGQGVVGRVAEEREGHLVTDRGSGTPTGGDRATVAVPVGERGVLRAGADETDRLDKFDLDVANVLAAHAATALDRTAREEALASRETQLERQNDRLERFAGLVSHDLRTPLEVARGNVELGMLDDDEDRLSAAIDALDRADELIDDMLTFARTGEHVTNESTVHVSDVAHDAWTAEFDAVGELSVETGRVVTADEDRLRQLFENLYRNAIEHGREPGEEVVRVRVSDTPDGFAVADDGPGLPDTAGDPFDPGVSTADDGTGFGLSLVQEIATAHGWAVSVDSGTDETYDGARFAVHVGATDDESVERGTGWV